MSELSIKKSVKPVQVGLFLFNLPVLSLRL